MLMKEKKVFKYNEDDILEFMTESLAAQLGFEEFSAKAILVSLKIDIYNYLTPKFNDCYAITKI